MEVLNTPTTPGRNQSTTGFRFRVPFPQATVLLRARKLNNPMISLENSLLFFKNPKLEHVPSFLLQMSLVRKQNRSSQRCRKLPCGPRARRATAGEALPWEDPAIARAGRSGETKWLRRKEYGLKTTPYPLPILYTSVGQITHCIQIYQNIVIRTYKSLHYSKEGFNFLPTS